MRQEVKKISSFRLVDLFFMSATVGIIIQHLTDENQSSGRKMGGLTEGKKKQQQKKNPEAPLSLCVRPLFCMHP